MTDAGDLNKSNGDIFYAEDVSAIVSSIGTKDAQLAYEQVKFDSTNWSNTDYLGADIFTDSNGAKDTVDTGNSTGLYDSDNENYVLGYTDEASGDSTHDPDSFTNSSNAFDSDDNTYASKNGTTGISLGKTFAAKDVGSCSVKFSTLVYSTSSYNAGGTTKAYSVTISIQTYNGITWSDAGEVLTYNGTHGNLSENSTIVNLGTTITGLNIEDNIEGIRIIAEYSFVGGVYASFNTFNVYRLEYGDYDTSATVETNTIIDDIVPDSIVVYGKTDIPTDTSITVDVSDDGGSTFALTGNSLNTAIDTSTFTTGDLALKFNLATTDTSVTPKLFGYGISITDS